ncbi:MAG: CDP-glucose 4,6-dehydratase [Ginsengibacter sp.]
MGIRPGKMEGLVMLHNIGRHYHNRKVFVTGHTGFKGSWFITWLHLLGAKVKGYALEADEKSLFNTVSSYLNFENVTGDIRDKEKLQTEILNFQPDLIFHFAAQSLVRRSYEIPAETFEVNATGTANLLEAVVSLKKKCAVIVVTTDKVYENKETYRHYKETDVLGGYDPYSASKACSEIIVNSFRNSFFTTDNYDIHQKTIATARAGNVIGGGDWNTDRIIPDIIRSLSKGNPVGLRNQHSVRPWQHVLEPLSGYLLLGALLHENTRQFSGAYNFGPGADDHLPVKQLVEIAISCWGEGTWVDASDDTQPHEAGLLLLDIGKAKNELSWKPKLNSKEAIEWTVEWYKQADENKFEYTLQQIKNYQQQ